MPSTRLDDRSLIEVSGADARAFLQGLVTCDMDKVSATQPAFGALLSAQGKILTDFIITQTDEGFLLDTPSAQSADLLKRLSLYKLRAQITLRLRDDLGVAAIWDEPASEGLTDPRSAELGSRAIVARTELVRFGANAPAYEAKRIAAGIPKGGLDFTYGDAFPHDVNMDLIGGVDFRKGCYVGQEVVSRVQHRSTARRRIRLVRLSGPAPTTGTPILAGDVEIGTIGSMTDAIALASLRIDKFEDAKT
ncbi:MAG: hypothetical protein RIQ68_750, partial [Pseudomonadota bacterium]